MTWLLCDYGEVLSTAQPAEDRSALVAASNLDPEMFWARYWGCRPPYDRGDVSAAEYWDRVLGSTPAHGQLEALVALDVASWLHLNQAAVAAAMDAGRRGYRLAILSNAPPEVTVAVDGAPWLAAFRPRIFSCRLRLVKPEPEVFQRCIELLGAQPEEIVFFDDREANVAAATAFGIQAHLFVDAAQIEALPRVPSS